VLELKGKDPVWTYQFVNYLSFMVPDYLNKKIQVDNDVKPKAQKIWNTPIRGWNMFWKRDDDEMGLAGCDPSLKQYSSL
jgi:hypothetical protein